MQPRAGGRFAEWQRPAGLLSSPYGVPEPASMPWTEKQVEGQVVSAHTFAHACRLSRVHVCSSSSAEMVRQHCKAAARQVWAAQRRLLLDLEEEEPQVDVLGGQQLVALHRVHDGQWHVVRLVAFVSEDKVVDDGADLHVVVGALEQQEGALQGCCDLAFEKQLEGQRALARQVGVAL